MEKEKSKATEVNVKISPYMLSQITKAVVVEGSITRSEFIRNAINEKLKIIEQRFQKEMV